MTVETAVAVPAGSPSLEYGACHCGETERVLVHGHCAPCVETCRPDLLAQAPEEWRPFTRAEIQRIAIDAIDLFVEFRDRHDKTEEQARDLAASDTAEGAFVDLAAVRRWMAETGPAEPATDLPL